MAASLSPPPQARSSVATGTLAISLPDAGSGTGAIFPWWLGSGPGGTGLATAAALVGASDVRIGIIEQGIALEHASLSGSNILTAQTGGSVTGALAAHGTQVAALLVGDLSEFGGGPGAIRGATLVLSSMSMTGTVSPTAINAALDAQRSVDVLNNSWGAGPAFTDNFRSTAWVQTSAKLQSLATEGREGLGTSMVFAAGNGRLMVGGQNIGDDANFHSLSNARHSIAVAATDSAGAVAFFSSPGTNLLLAAPGHGVISAAAGGGAEAVSGTSFAAPLVSGTIGLMLEANPALGWRDVQEILAMTARPAMIAGSVANAGSGVNGGGMVFHRDTGFGLLDAEAAVRLARTWTVQSTSANEAHVFVTHAPRVQADPMWAEFLFDIPARDAEFRLDWVTVTLTVQDPRLRELRIELVSPAGTSALIAPNLVAAGTRTWLDFTFSSAVTRGEDIAGLWTLRLIHPEGTPRLSVYGARLDFFGDVDSADDVFVFTKAYRTLASGDAARRLIVDRDGGEDALNFAAAAPGLSINLLARQARLDGVEITFDGLFERVIGTAGNDTIAGDAVASNLSGEDGNDSIVGRGAADTLSGGAGDDTLLGGGGADIMAGGPGNDWLWVDHADDVVIETAGGGRADRVLTSVSYRLGPDVEVEHLSTSRPSGTSAIDLTGNDLAQVITGNAGANRLTGMGGNDLLLGREGDDTLIGGDGRDSLDGGPGSDWMAGGAGDDTYRVDAAGDVVVETAGGGRADRVLASVSYGLGQNVEVEHLSTALPSGTSAIDLTGNDLAQVITGNAGMNRLTGMGGNDVLRGLNGADTLCGGGGNDTLIGGAGADVFVFTKDWGRDRIQDFNPSLAGEVIDLRAVPEIVDFADLSANHLSELSGHATIIVGGNSITLQGVSMASLTQDAFLFAQVDLY